MERYAYTNPSAEQSSANEVSRSVDDGVTCRVENLPADLCAPVEQTFTARPRNGVSMRTQHNNGPATEEGVRFLLDGEERPAHITSLTGPAHITSLTGPRGMTKSPSSFASFDQLFDEVDDFQYPLPPAYGRTDSDKGFYSDDPPDTPADNQGTQRTDSSHLRMCNSSLRQLVRESWENTGSFRSFQRRLGPNLNDKYCMRLNIHATIFMFMHVLYGATLLTMATFTWNRTSGVDPLVGTYLLVTGALSVFIFPIMIMEWSPRVGGCLDEDTSLDNYYFVVALFLRLCACAAGTVCVYYRYPVYYGPGADPQFAAHLYEFLGVGLSVCLDWAILFLMVILPTGCYLCCYCCARTRLCKPRKKKLSKEKLELVNNS